MIVNHKIIEQCQGCQRVKQDNQTCYAYLYPETKWRLGNCPLATHLAVRIDVDTPKKRVGQQKQRKV